MNIYLVERTDEIDWDQYDSHVAVAVNAKQAKELCEDRSNRRGLGSLMGEPRGAWLKADVKKLGNSTRYRKPQIVHSSFKAG